MFIKLATFCLLVACATARFTTPRYTTRNAERPLKALADRNGVKIWNDKGSFGGKDLTIYEATRPSGTWYILGQRAQNNYERMANPIHAFKASDNSRYALARPAAFTFLWDDRGGTTKDGSAWRPVCSRGYVSIGDVFINKNRQSSAPRELFDKVRCVSERLAERCDGLSNKIWDNAGAWGKYYISVWATRPRRSTLEGYFYANNQHNSQPNVTPYCLRNDAFEVL